MKKTKITLMAQTILQLDAGSYPCVVDGGDTYILLHQSEAGEEVVAHKSAPNNAQAEKPAPPAKKEAANDSVDDPSTWTDEEMLAMPTEDLMQVIEDNGIELSKNGKNTNKKLRTAILDHYNGGGSVADDTREEEEEEAPAPARRRAVAKPAEVEIPKEDWDDLEIDTLVKAKLDMEGAEGEKLWEAKIVGWKKPAGSKTEELHVFFIEDGQEDYLREGDKLYEHSVTL